MILMTSLRSWLVSGAVLTAMAGAATSASAQEGRIGLHVNFGAQSGSGNLSQQLRPTIYDETATIDISQGYKNGPLVDVGGDYIVFGRFGVGVSYSHTSGDGNAALAGQIPDPLYYDLPRGAAASVTGQTHAENAVHISALYRFAAAPKLDVTVGIGPTFFSVKQDLVTRVDVTEGASGPVMAPTSTELSDSAVGVNISADAAYMVTKNIGAGLLLRFARSTATLTAPEATGSVDVRTGGFQVGVGLRVRF
jgi:Outer membrane protein beta-barrel domain